MLCETSSRVNPGEEVDPLRGATAKRSLTRGNLSRRLPGEHTYPTQGRCSERRRHLPGFPGRSVVRSIPVRKTTKTLVEQELLPLDRGRNERTYVGAREGGRSLRGKIPRASKACARSRCCAGEKCRKAMPKVFEGASGRSDRQSLPGRAGPQKRSYAQAVCIDASPKGLLAAGRARQICRKTPPRTLWEQEKTGCSAHKDYGSFGTNRGAHLCFFFGRMKKI